jgi:hypothetical protein
MDRRGFLGAVGALAVAGPPSCRTVEAMAPKLPERLSLVVNVGNHIDQWGFDVRPLLGQCVRSLIVEIDESEFKAFFDSVLSGGRFTPKAKLKMKCLRSAPTTHQPVRGGGVLVEVESRLPVELQFNRTCSREEMHEYLEAEHGGLSLANMIEIKETYREAMTVTPMLVLDFTHEEWTKS